MAEKAGLICEGEGTKAAYTYGVLQHFLDYDIEFPYIAGISADAEVLSLFVAKQKDRLRATGVDTACGSDAIGVSPLTHEKGVFGIGYVCKFVEEHAPLDYGAFMNSKTLLDIGIYNMDINEVGYFPEEYLDPEEQILMQANCAPLLFIRPYKFRGHTYMDTGLIDMIPIEQSIRQGGTEHVFIPTKEEDYVRESAPGWQIQLAKLMYPGNKTIREDLKIRHINYRKQWQIVKELEEQGNAIALRPGADYRVTYYTHGKELLGCWFNLGYEGMKDRLDMIREFTEK